MASLSLLRFPPCTRQPCPIRPIDGTWSLFHTHTYIHRDAELDKDIAELLLLAQSPFRLQWLFAWPGWAPSQYLGLKPLNDTNHAMDLQMNTDTSQSPCTLGDNATAEEILTTSQSFLLANGGTGWPPSRHSAPPALDSLIQTTTAYRTYLPNSNSLSCLSSRCHLNQHPLFCCWICSTG